MSPIAPNALWVPDISGIVANEAKVLPQAAVTLPVADDMLLTIMQRYRPRFCASISVQPSPAASLILSNNRPPVEQADEPTVLLPAITLGEAVVEDYRSISLSLKSHPLALLRPKLRAAGILPTAALATYPEGRSLTVAGLVLVRQRPGTALGMVFVTIEDETGAANVIVWSSVLERHRRAVLRATLLGVRGKVQREGLVIHVIADRLIDLSPEPRDLSQLDGAFERAIARADGVRRPDPGSRRVFPEARNFR